MTNGQTPRLVYKLEEACLRGVADSASFITCDLTRRNRRALQTMQKTLGTMINPMKTTRTITSFAEIL